MVKWLVSAGVDLLLVETMNTLREALAALEAAREITQVPIIVSLVPKDPSSILSGESIQECVQRLAESGADMVCLNCHSLSVMRGAFATLREAADQIEIPFGLYPNMCEQLDKVTWDLCATTDESLADAAEAWLADGARLIGSCCGSSPKTTVRLGEILTRG